MARHSRPLGFDMAYRPRERLYGLHWSARVVALGYLGVTLAVLIFVLVGERMPSASWWYHYVVVADTSRIMGIRTFALLLLGSSVCGLIRSGMRGVQIGPEGVETRDVEMLVVPRVRRLIWTQLERIVLDQPTRIALDLWDGSRLFLPRVRDRQGLSTVLQQVALARAIPVRGGSGLDELVDAEELGLRVRPSS